LIVTRFSGDPLTHDEILDLDFPTGQTFFVTGQDHARGFKLLNVRFVVVRLGQDRKYLMLHSAQQRRRIVTPAFDPPDLDFPIFANGEETIRDGNTLVLLRWKENDVAVDGLDCQG